MAMQHSPFQLVQNTRDSGQLSQDAYSKRSLEFLELAATVVRWKNGKQDGEGRETTAEGAIYQGVQKDMVSSWYHEKQPISRDHL